MLDEMEIVSGLHRKSLIRRMGQDLARLPFPVLEVHPDNGSEFFNDHLRCFWHDRYQAVQLSRSRPFQPNHNRFVEQKNNTLARAYFAAQRLDTVRQTNLLDRLYDHMWLYDNFFQPVLRLEEKTILPGVASPVRIRRKFDKACTPFDRLCATGILPSDVQAQLETLRNRTNPRQLRREIYHLIDHLLRMPCARSHSTQDVYATLPTQPSPMKGGTRAVTSSIDRTMTAR